MHGGRRTALSSPGVLDSFLGSIVQVGHNPGYFGRLENLTKPDSMSFLEFFHVGVYIYFPVIPSAGGYNLNFRK